MHKVLSGFLIFCTVMFGVRPHVVFADESGGGEVVVQEEIPAPPSTDISTEEEYNEVPEETTQGDSDSPDGEPGVLGEDGNDGEGTQEEQIEEPLGDVIVETGEAVAIADIVTEENTSDIVVTGADESTIDTDNTGALDNGIEVEATTGNTSASAGAGMAVAVTGDALAVANVVNVVNTNIIDSEGLLLFLNTLTGSDGIDLSNTFSLFDTDNNNEPSTGCSLLGCGSGTTDTTVNVNNNADIVNDIVVRAQTGGNVTSSIAGSAGAISGNAIAQANVINVANTNIIDSQYLLLTFSNIGDLLGDIVLPGADFFNQFFGGSGSLAGNTSVAHTNDADISTSLTVDASTGGNTAHSEHGVSAIATGNGNAHASIVNQVNTNLFNSDSFYMLINVHGDWAGEIFGLPEGISWSQTDFGIQLFSTPGYGTTPQSLMPESFSLGTSNAASISNTIGVYALTGDNEVTAGGDAIVHTGDAHASASVVNIANTNVVGRNWALAILNIFGSWNGNLSFGRPDLWIGGQALYGGSNALPGSGIEYIFSIKNNGNAVASDVYLKTLFNEGLLDFSSSGSYRGPGTLGNTIPSIAPGETVTVSYRGQVTSGLPFGSTPLVVTAEVISRENDANTSDNKEELTVMGLHVTSQQGGVPVVLTADSNVVLEKTNSTNGTINPGEKVRFSIVIRNTGGPTYHSLVVDRIIDEYGTVLNEEYWDLGQVLPNEEVTVSYDVIFSEDTYPGAYRNEAQLIAVDRHNSLYPFFGRRIESNKASSEVVVLPQIAQVTSVASQSAYTCNQYMFEYLKFGESNDAGEVMKLQRFLNMYEGFNLEVHGVYDVATRNAVQAFQEKYAEDILDPWGIEEGTGFVYYTTRKKINDIWCEGEIDFSLSDEQLKEIFLFRQKLKELERAGAPFPDTSIIGMGNTREVFLADADVAHSDIVPSTAPQEIMKVTNIPTPLLTGMTQVAKPPQEALDAFTAPFLRGFFKRVEAFFTQVRVTPDGDVTMGDSTKGHNQ